VCLDPAEAKGSARTAHGVHVVRALDRASPALLRYGGHAAAAGFSLEPAQFEEFSELVCEAVAAQLGGAPRERVVAIDAGIVVADATPSLCRELARMEPCGLGNAAPVLALRGARVLSTSTFGADSQHVRVLLAGDGGLLEATAFHKPALAHHLPRGRVVDAAFSLEMDTWQGQLRVRARLRDLRPAEPVEPVAFVTGRPVRGACSASPGVLASA